MPFQRNSSDRPVIDSITPLAALPGGDFHIHGKSFLAAPRPLVAIGGVSAPLTVGSNCLVVARVPEGTGRAEVIVSNGEQESDPTPVALAALVADSLHPVGNPAVDAAGNIFTTFSGSRGQKTPVSLYRIDLNYRVTPFLNDIMNP